MTLLNPTVAWLTFRATAGRRRILILALAPLVLVGISLALKASAPAGTNWPGHVLGDFAFSILLPLTALILGTSVLGAEIDDGSAIHLLATPVPRAAVIVTKFVVATGLTIACVAVPEFLGGLIATSTGTALRLLAGAVAGSAIYCALFVALSALTTRSVMYGLLYVLLWEGVLANVVGGARIVSASHYAMGIADAPSIAASGLSFVTAVTMGTVVTLAALVLAVRRLAGFSLARLAD